MGAMTLADQIEVDVAARLRSGALGAADLRLLPLAAHYQTSTRPVRTALARLREQGFIPGNGHAATPRAAKAVSRVETRASTTRELADRIARDLVGDALRDEDRFVRETRTADRYGVSTTIVREIFNRLVGQGMLEHVARRGWRVRRLTQKDLDDFIEVREALEVKSLRASWDRMEPKRFETFLEGNAMPGSTSGAPKLDNTFHGEMIRLADNRYISEFFERHGRYFDIVFAWEAQNRQAMIQAVGQHRRILKCILKRDLPRAESALVDHIHNNHPILKEVLTRRRGSTRERRPSPR